MADEKSKKKLRHGLAEDAPLETSEASMRDERVQELESYLRESVGIDPLQISNEYIRVPADLAFWNARYAKALRRFLTAKVNIDITRARLEPMMRQAIINAGGKPTEKQVDAQIEAHQDVIDMRFEVVEAEVEKNEMFGCLDAIRSKKEMLVSLGAHMRAELQGDPTLRDQQKHFNRGEG